jgi:hypothetical protein
MRNIKLYEDFIAESMGTITWIVMTKTGKIVLNTKEEEKARKKSEESSDYVLYFRKGQDPVRRA